MFLGVAKLNSSFPMGALKVAVSGLCEGKDREADMSLRYLNAPASTSQTDQPHWSLGKSLKLFFSGYWEVFKDLWQHEYFWLLHKVYHETIQVVVTESYFIF